jgi:CO/xanthine dehydrogenase FAD-binding subunit
VTCLGHREILRSRCAIIRRSPAEGNPVEAGSPFGYIAPENPRGAMGTYLRPVSLENALAALAARRLTVLAGGTDFYPARVGRLIDEDVLDITAVAELRGIRDADGWLRIGAAATWTELLEARLPRQLDALKLAAREVGGVQIQNAGTIAGNLCNASPAADGVPALLALDAEVELRASARSRRLPLAEFVLGNRSTACAPDELVTAVLVPKWGAHARSTFLKLGARRYLVISIAMVAAAVDIAADGAIRRACVAVGACSPAARRLPALEDELVGRRLGADLGELVAPRHLVPLAPISDVRGTAEYRNDAVVTLVRRALRQLADE